METTCSASHTGNTDVFHKDTDRDSVFGLEGKIMKNTINLNNQQAKYIVILGKVAQKYYDKEFPDAIILQHPAYLARQGGVRSPNYTINLRKLKEGLKYLRAYDNLTNYNGARKK